MTYTRKSHLPSNGEVGGMSPTYSPERHVAERLAWSYGAGRAWAAHRNLDPETNADVARWKALGTKGVGG